MILKVQLIQVLIRIAVLAVAAELQVLGQSGLLVQTGEGAPVEVKSELWSQLERQKLSMKDHDGHVSNYEGVSLLSLLEREGAPDAARMRGRNLAVYIVAEGSDGYQVVFSMGELSPAIQGLAAIIADRRDGQPLAEKEGPLRLVVPSDKKPARSVRMLTRLRILTAPHP